MRVRSAVDALQLDDGVALEIVAAKQAREPDILADRAFALLKRDLRHPSLHFKKVARFWSVRVGLHHRAIGVDPPDGILGFWTAAHSAYDSLIN
jgi:hypothetical protein